MATPAAPPFQIVHGSAVAIAGRAVLITGASGSGKSGLALQLLALGAELLADDRTQLTRAGDKIIASAPEAIQGQIEARFVGILKAPPAAPAPIALIVNMDTIETERLPPWRTSELMGLTFPCVHKTEGYHFPAAILQYVNTGRLA
ncbi:HPr kinase/phosphorylase [Lentibacter sp. XHP0401]|uniref:HPr kinase/phosphorylase n=1 Tax=Lentibacter sp. XHP0401 TaxID=2984334 RepID=UPI0021E8294A|nr:serine kinase [Lentibacter sp. XHP0401]MCV2894368.1 serine kinase [Lentibacter sp. XHP0401]